MEKLVLSGLSTSVFSDAPVELSPAVILAVKLPLIPLFVGGVVVLLAAGFLAVRRGLSSPAYRLRKLSPERITAYRSSGGEQSVEDFAASIAERANEISRVLEEDSSEIRAEMCALGYRRCANDMITLTHRVNEEAPGAPLARRLRMKRARKRAVEALSRARESLPPEALRATRQEK